MDEHPQASHYGCWSSEADDQKSFLLELLIGVVVLTIPRMSALDIGLPSEDLDVVQKV